MTIERTQNKQSGPADEWGKQYDQHPGHQSSGFGPGSNPPVATPNIETEVRHFTNRLKRKFPVEIAADPKGFKKRVVSRVRRGLPPFAGRPSEMSVTRAVELRKAGIPWQKVYPECIPNHGCLPPAQRRLAETKLRDARRSRANARRRRRRRSVMNCAGDLPAA